MSSRDPNTPLIGLLLVHTMIKLQVKLQRVENGKTATHAGHREVSVQDVEEPTMGLAIVVYQIPETESKKGCDHKNYTQDIDDQ